MFDFLKKKGAEIAERKEAILKYGMPIFAILILVNTIQLARFGRIVESVDNYKEGLVDELGGFRQDITRFGDDINEIRNYLLLPTQDYSFIEQGLTEESDDLIKATDTEQALYKYIGAFVDKQKINENTLKALAEIKYLQENKDLIDALKEDELVIGKLEQSAEIAFFVISTKAEKLFGVTADLKQGSLQINDTTGGSKTLINTSEDSQKQEVITYVKNNKEAVESAITNIKASKALIADLMKDGEIINPLNQKKLYLIEESPGVRYQIINDDQFILLTIVIGQKDGSIQINDKPITQADNLKAILISIIDQLDGTTDMDRIVAKRRAEFEGVMKEEAFNELLKTIGFNVAESPREEYNKLIYDVTDSEGNLQFSFVIELSSGLVKILKDNQETDIFSALPQNAKKKL